MQNANLKQLIICVIATALLTAAITSGIFLLAGTRQVNDTSAEDEPIPYNLNLPETVKIAATRVGYNRRPRNINPDLADKNLNIDSVKAFVNGNLNRTIAAIRMAGEQGADLVVTHEDIMSAGPYARNELRHVFEQIAETIPGPTSEKLSAIAREFNMHITACYYEQDKDKFYNTAVLIGRKGEIVGKYRMIHLPGLLRWIVEPGDKIPVFKTDIGNIGISTCHDIMYPEQMRALALKGADIIVHPSAIWGFLYGDRNIIGENLARVRAVDNQCFLVYAKNYPGGKSCIVSNDGTILAENADTDNDGIAIAEFKPTYDMMFPESYWSFLANVPSIRARLLYERQPGTYGIITKEVPNIINDRYNMYKFSGWSREITDSIGDLWNKWRQGAIRLPYVWN